MGTSSPHTDDDAVARLAEQISRMVDQRIGAAEERIGGQIWDLDARVTELIEPVNRLITIAHWRGETKVLAAGGIQTGEAARTTRRPARWHQHILCRMGACVAVTALIVGVAAYVAWGQDGDQVDDQGATLAIPPTATAPAEPPATPRRSPDPEGKPRADDAPGDVSGGRRAGASRSGRDTPRLPTAPPSSSPRPSPPPEMIVEGDDCDRRLLALRRMQVCRDQP